MIITACLLVFGLSGCDTFEDIFENEQEVSGAIEQIGDDFVVVDATRFVVTADTQYDGIAGLGDLSVGDDVEVEYEDRGGQRVAVEIEFGDND